MFKIAAACIAAALLCSACLTAKDLECWYDDMCMAMDGAKPAPQSAHDAQPVRAGR